MPFYPGIDRRFPGTTQPLPGIHHPLPGVTHPFPAIRHRFHGMTRPLPPLSTGRNLNFLTTEITRITDEILRSLCLTFFLKSVSSAKPVPSTLSGSVVSFSSNCTSPDHTDCRSPATGRQRAPGPPGPPGSRRSDQRLVLLSTGK